MSTRHLTNLTTAAVATLLVAAVAVAVSTRGRNGPGEIQQSLVARQQTLVEDLTRQAVELAEANSREDVEQARGAMGRTIVTFDRTLTALLHGGTAPDAAGVERDVRAVKSGNARRALERGASLWLDTGLPLSDLAAGEYSVFSAAGRRAVQGLEDNHVALLATLDEAAGHLERAAAMRASMGRYALFAAAGLGALLAVLMFNRRSGAPATAPAGSSAPATAPETVEAVPAPASQPGMPLQPAPRDDAAAPYRAPVDFDSVNAAVDQMSVDMNTIAGSTDKMRVAIDSVGFALQGMLFSLREMAQDTAEGAKIVRGANNAASFTADTAENLAESAREMSRVVGRVTQLALRTRQIAGQIEGEAVHTGKTGEAFTSVVANEVRGLASRTNQATAEIDQTVESILKTAREYEEAIGQIIKNVAAINKVSQNLGELMLSPPPRVEAGAPLPAATATPPAPSLAAQPAAAPAPAPAPEPAAVMEEPDPAPEPSADEVAEATSDAIAEAAVEPEPEPEPEAAADDEPEADGGSNNNVFMLGKPKAKPAARAEAEPEVAEEPAAEAEPPAETPEAEPETAEADEQAVADGGSNNNVFMLGKPKAQPAPEVAAGPEVEPEAAVEPTAAVEPEPEPAPEPEAEPAEADGGSNNNVFMLNRPKKEAPAAAEPAPEPEAAAEPEAEAEPEPEPVPVPADEPENEESSGSNIFMLNKPK